MGTGFEGHVQWTMGTSHWSRFNPLNKGLNTVLMVPLNILSLSVHCGCLFRFVKKWNLNGPLRGTFPTFLLIIDIICFFGHIYKFLINDRSRSEYL